MSAPAAPWSLSGECVVGLCSGSPLGGRLPAGICRIPGPVVVVAARYADSPVGPYAELVVLEPARAGARPGFCATTMVVNSADSRVGGRVNWGFPKELGTLMWSDEAGGRKLRWEERGITVSGSPGGPPLPALLPFRTVQRRTDGVVTAASRAWGLGRLATVEVDIPEDDELAPLAGRHRGLVLSGLRLGMSAARLHERARAAKPSREAPEPALSLAPRGD